MWVRTRARWLFSFPSSHSAYANQLLKEPFSSCAWRISHQATRDNDWISTCRLKTSNSVHIRSNQLLIPSSLSNIFNFAWYVFASHLGVADFLPSTKRLLLIAPHCSTIIYGAKWKAKRKDELRFSRMHTVLTLCWRVRQFKRVV